MSASASRELFASVARERRYEAVVRQVLALIAAGEIAPGSRLPAERDLAERLGVSRNVLREAFRVLEARGIGRARPGGGLFVGPREIYAAVPAAGVVLRRAQAGIARIVESGVVRQSQVERRAA